MAQLSDKGYWDSIYNAERLKNHGLWKRFKSLMPRDGFPRLIACLLRKHAKIVTGMKILEIGCAPGLWLIDLARLLNLTPFGLDYSEKGCEMARQNFRAAGYPPDQVMQGDFFDDNFMGSIKDKFDIVCSFGFVEHFSDLQGIVWRHFPLLRKGGWLCVTMPNLLGLNQFLQRQDILDMHYLPSMKRGALKKAMLGIQEIKLTWAGYFGGFEWQRTFPTAYVPLFTPALQRLVIDPPMRLMTSWGICPNFPCLAPHIGGIAQRF